MNIRTRIASLVCGVAIILIQIFNYMPKSSIVFIVIGTLIIAINVIGIIQEKQREIKPKSLRQKRIR